MVGVRNRKGNIVNVDVKGIAEVMRFVMSQGNNIEQGADMGVVRAGEYIQSEVVESIIGNRAEERSVSTGQLGNSINFFKTGDAKGVVKPEKQSYPNSSATTTEVAAFMEYGTSKNPNPRLHFRNTEKRTKPKARDIIEAEIKQKLRFGI